MRVMTAVRDLHPTEENFTSNALKAPVEPLLQFNSTQFGSSDRSAILTMLKSAKPSHQRAAAVKKVKAPRDRRAVVHKRIARQGKSRLTGMDSNAGRGK